MKGAAAGGETARASATTASAPATRPTTTATATTTTTTTTATATGERPPAPEADRDPAISAELAVLRQVAPPVALVARVMTKVADPPALTFWQWLRRPFRVEIRLTPLGAIAFAVGLAVGVALFAAPRLHPWAAALLKIGRGPSAPAPAASAPAR